jgi:hypothetical protein
MVLVPCPFFGLLLYAKKAFLVYFVTENGFVFYSFFQRVYKGRYLNKLLALLRFSYS